MKLITLAYGKYFIRLTLGAVNTSSHVLSLNEHYLGYFFRGLLFNVEINVVEATSILVKEDRGVK